MSRARHAKRASGGAVARANGGVVAYSGGDSNVMKEAHERKRGGKVAEVDGEMAKPRHGRPGRKRGGRVGADKAPLSSAATISQKSFEEKEGGNHSK